MTNKTLEPGKKIRACFDKTPGDLRYGAIFTFDKPVTASEIHDLVDELAKLAAKYDLSSLRLVETNNAS